MKLTGTDEISWESSNIDHKDEYWKRTLKAIRYFYVNTATGITENNNARLYSDYNDNYLHIFQHFMKE